MTTRQHLDKLGEPAEPQTLYQTDFYAWTQRQAAHLRDEEFNEVDWQNLIEEIESMGNSEQSELENRLTTIIMHRLKMMYQPTRRGNSWTRTIQTQRIDLARHLRKNPSLRADLTETVADVYADAVKKADIETGLTQATFPAACPWTATQLLDEDWLPRP